MKRGKRQTERGKSQVLHTYGTTVVHHVHLPNEALEAPADTHMAAYIPPQMCIKSTHSNKRTKSWQPYAHNHNLSKAKIVYVHTHIYGNKTDDGTTQSMPRSRHAWHFICGCGETKSPSWQTLRASCNIHTSIPISLIG